MAAAALVAQWVTLATMAAREGRGGKPQTALRCDGSHPTAAVLVLGPVPGLAPGPRCRLHSVPSPIPGIPHGEKGGPLLALGAAMGCSRYPETLSPLCIA